jgi:hypothetical protein
MLTGVSHKSGTMAIDVCVRFENALGHSKHISVSALSKKLISDAVQTRPSYL